MESKTNTCRFDSIKCDALLSGYFLLSLTDICHSGLVLEKVCEYLYYNEKHKDSTNVADMDIPPELCLELLMAADYLSGTRACLSHLN